VVALGVDAARADPESPLDVTAEGFHSAGRVLGATGLPIVVVQEGGYDLDAIGGLVTAALTGIEAGARG
jgi:acetoin utilization deacetylase AcuC-like enzyme